MNYHLRTGLVALAVAFGVFAVAGCYTQISSVRSESYEPEYDQSEQYYEEGDSSEYTDEQYYIDRDRFYYDYYYPSAYVNTWPCYAGGSYAWWWRAYDPFAWCGTSYPIFGIGLWSGFNPWYYPYYYYPYGYYGHGGYVYVGNRYGDTRTFGTTRGTGGIRSGGGTRESGSGAYLPTGTVSRGNDTKPAGEVRTKSKGGRSGSSVSGGTRSGTRGGTVDRGSRGSSGRSREATRGGGSRRSAPPPKSTPPSSDSGGGKSYSPPPSSSPAPPASGGGGTRSGGESRDSGRRGNGR